MACSTTTDIQDPYILPCVLRARLISSSNSRSHQSSDYPRTRAKIPFLLLNRRCLTIWKNLRRDLQVTTHIFRHIITRPRQLHRLNRRNSHQTRDMDPPLHRKRPRHAIRIEQRRQLFGPLLGFEVLTSQCPEERSAVWISDDAELRAGVVQLRPSKRDDCAL